jgi:S1-C subfamily serine protease
VEGEDQGTPERDSGEGWDDEVDREPTRGWISPDDRLWRHPSESRAAPSSSPARIDGTAAQKGHRTGTYVAGGATACLVLALVTVALVMATTARSDPDGSGAILGKATFTGAPTTEPGTAKAVARIDVTTMVSNVRHSTVVLSVDKAAGTSTSTGVVAESGGIIVTSAAVLAGARSVTAIEPDGSRQAATVVGTDPDTGLAVVHISDDLPAATFDEQDPSVGTMAVAMAVEEDSRTKEVPVPSVYAGMVVSTGQAAGSATSTSTSPSKASASAFAATMLEAPLTGDDIGCPLLAGNGQVWGVLEGTRQIGSTTVSVFLPAELVVGVAQQLVDSGRVEHGWLGLDTSDAQPASAVTVGSGALTSHPTGGALVDAVDDESPAAGQLMPGDIITGVDGEQVRSDAEFQTRLYADPPGTALTLTFQRAGRTLTSSVVLASPDADTVAAAPGGVPSP